MDIVGMSVTQQMRDYCNLKESCGRAFLLQDFDADDHEHPPVKGCKCCDLYLIMQLCWLLQNLSLTIIIISDHKYDVITKNSKHT